MTDTRYTVLIAEDAADIRSILARLLQQSGYRVIETKNGQEALTSLQGEWPDVVLLDLSMPVVDGWETLSAIRALPGGAQLPVVAITAHAMVGDREAVLSHGFDAYIMKPLDLRGLVNMVQQLLQNQRPLN
jgi:two-component system, cell cycle response regulator DivK